MNDKPASEFPEVVTSKGIGSSALLGSVSDERSLLEWAETLLCNAACPPHSTGKEWSEIIHKWRDAKHGLPASKTTTARVRALLPYMREPESDMLRRALTETLDEDAIIAAHEKRLDDIAMEQGKLCMD